MENKNETVRASKDRPFRRAVWRGVALVLPPLLTVVILLWMASTIRYYLLDPMYEGTRNVLAWQLTERFSKEQPDQAPPLSDGTRVAKAPPDKRLVVELRDGNWVPREVYDEVRRTSPGDAVPGNVRDVYRRYVETEFLQPYKVIPIFIFLFILMMYVLGKFLAAGIGTFFWSLLERGIHRLPLVRNVYASVKQVTDFMFASRELEYLRVVAVEYPRKGIWSLGFVTGESLMEIGDTTKEPMLCLYVPGSPMPVTGYAVTVRKQDCVELNITIDQALQFLVSCGVVVPPHQLPQRTSREAGNIVARGSAR